MEPENEPLDWGNEDEEQQEALRRSSHDYATRDARVAEEVEDDTISLGDEEEQGYYLQRENESKELHNASNDSLDRPPSAQRRAGSMGANDQHRSQHEYRGRDNFEGASQPSNRSPESTPRRRNSRNQTSPTQFNTTRLKHALPPKPLPANVPYLPPSHPSIVSATSMTEISPRAASNDTKKANGAGEKHDLSPTPGDLPYPWEQRSPRNGGQPYYYNKDTEKSTWLRPVSSIPSSSSGQSRRRTRSGSSSQTYVTTSNSDIHHTQTSRANRDHSHSRPDPDIEDMPRGPAADPRDLSYEDRHYRPGGEPAPAASETRPVLRSEAVGSQFSRSRYERSPVAAPTRQRRPPRSLSPPDIRVPQDHPRSQEFSRRNDHISRERNSHTNADPSLSRDVDMLPSDRWAPPHDPHTEFDRSDRASRNPPRSIDDRDLDHPSFKTPARPPLARRPDNNRGVPRDREPPRQPNTREHPAENSGFISAPRYTRERDSGRDYQPYREPVSALGPPPPPDRKDRMPRFERSASLNGPPPGVGLPNREMFNQRGREYDSRPPPDNRPPPTYDQRRGGDRNFDRGRREHTPESTPPARHIDNHHVQAGPERPSRYPDPYDRPPPEEAAQISHRRRTPLPPQQTTFLSSGPSSGMPVRDPPPHVPMRDFAPKSQGWPNDDSNLPRRPKFDVNNSKPAPIERERSRPRTPPFEHEYRNNGPGPRAQDRGRHDYPGPQQPPKLDTRMDIDPRDLVSNRHPPSPRSARGLRIRMDNQEILPEGPRSARPAQNLQDRQPYYATAPSLIPPPNARYENGPPGGFPPLPPPNRPPYQDDRRFNDNRDSRDNRAGWKDTQPGPGRDNQLGRDNQIGRNNPPSNGYPDRNPPPPRREFRGRSDVGGRPPAVSGANTMPIGTRKTNFSDIQSRPLSGPPNGIALPPPASFGFNPDARPPSSTLINPSKALELDTMIQTRPVAEQSRLANQPDTPSQTAFPSQVDEQAAARAESKRRVSRFSPLIPKEPEKPSGQSQSTASEESNNIRNAPPITRDSSMHSLTEQVAAQDINRGQSSDGPRTPRSDRQTQSGRQEDQGFSSRASDDVPSSATAGAHAHILSSARATLSPTDSALQRRSDQGTTLTSPRVGDSEHGVDLQTSLSRRMSGEKPPRHRKYSAQYKVPEDILQAETKASEHTQDNSLKDRLDNGNNPKRTSLLDRLSSATENPAPSADPSDTQPQSLRDRLVPSKRDREEMVATNDPGPVEADDQNDTKRVKRRNTKGKRGGRR